MKVSVDTIRRDLNQLAGEGLVQRVHGGGLPASPALNPALERQFENQKSKEIIAEKAAQLVQNGSVVFLDGGTTAVQVATAIRPEKEFTVITHNPRAALVLAEKGGRAEIILLGGRIDHHDLVAMSPSTITEVRKYRASLFLLGICSIHPALGITCRTPEDLEVKRAMAEASAEVVGVATAEKLGTAGPMVLGPVSMLSHLVTDAGKVLPLALMAFVFFLTEGAIYDWSGVFLRTHLRVDISAAGIGYAGFSLMMAAIRFGGDFWVARFGRFVVFITGGLVGAAGLALACLGGFFPISIVGFGMVGVGLANCVPLIFSAAARQSEEGFGRGIAAVASAGYMGLFVGPPVIGSIAQVIGLQSALLLVAGSLVLTLFVTRAGLGQQEEHSLHRSSA